MRDTRDDFRKVAALILQHEGTNLAPQVSILLTRGHYSVVRVDHALGKMVGTFTFHRKHGPIFLNAAFFPSLSGDQVGTRSLVGDTVKYRPIFASEMALLELASGKPTSDPADLAMVRPALVKIRDEREAVAASVSQEHALVPTSNQH